MPTDLADLKSWFRNGTKHFRFFRMPDGGVSMTYPPERSLFTMLERGSELGYVRIEWTCNPDGTDDGVATWTAKAEQEWTCAND